MRVLRGVVYMTKSSGPRTEPWGTPQEEVCQEDRSVSHFTRKQRDVLAPFGGTHGATSFKRQTQG